MVGPRRQLDLFQGCAKLTSEETALIEYSLTDDSVTRGLYTLNISLNEEVVKSLPISVVNSNAPDASKTEFFGQANSGSVDTLYSFKLKLNNSDNKSLNIGNDFVVVTFSNKSESSASIVDLQNGTYSVQWTPKEEGDYSKEILINLLSNAIKFSDEGAIIVSCSCTPGQNPNTTTLITSVQDSGIGMTEEEIGRAHV